MNRRIALTDLVTNTGTPREMIEDGTLLCEEVRTGQVEREMASTLLARSGCEVVGV